LKTDSKTHLGWDASLCPCKDGDWRRESTRLGRDPNARSPHKDSSNGPFVSAILVPDPLAANNADKETFHMAEENSRNFFLLPIS